MKCIYPSCTALERKTNHLGNTTMQEFDMHSMFSVSTQQRKKMQLVPILIFEKYLTVYFDNFIKNKTIWFKTSPKQKNN